MSRLEIFDESAELGADLNLLECMTAARKAFVERICEESASKEAHVIEMLRLDSAYQLAEFMYLLRARGIASEEQIRLLADLHNDYIVNLARDEQKMARLGLNPNHLLDAMFTSDTMPRLLQHWREHPGAIDQSNLARFLFALMSAETCRKVLVACEAAGFIRRQKTAAGALLVVSRGVLEDIFGEYLRGLRQSIATGATP